MRKICVVGLGYIGLPTASVFANNGFNVLGVDTSALIVKAVNSRKAHIEESGLRTLIEAAVSSGHLKAASKLSYADAFIIAVPTPFDENKDPDLSHVYHAVEAILPYLQAGNLLVIESTVPPGTTANVGRFVAEHRPDLVDEKKESKVHVAHCPERVLPGRILKELVENDRVVGGVTEEASERAGRLYSAIVEGKIYKTDATTAEMVKLAENTFRDVNIALSNELSVICKKLGINVWDVIALANRHPRVNILNPGPGVGGHCIAVDPWFLVSEFPRETRLIRAARLRNDFMPSIVVEEVLRFIKGEKHPKIACLGASYKGNVGDSRNSPAIEVYRALVDRVGKKGVVALTDGYILNTEYPLQPLKDAVRDASVLVILTDHHEYKSLDPIEMAKCVRKRIVLDTRNVLNHVSWRAAGFEVHLIGDGKRSQEHLERR
jgi:UDP-N-acetyl-D-mannosaminuronic acid dehydrogenase